MPHFYRYRADDDDLSSRRSRTPAAALVDPRGRSDEVHVRCLGYGAEICIPGGDDKNKANLNSLFYELDKTIQGLRDENKQLRAELDYVKDICKNSSSKMAAAPVPVAAASSNGNVDEKLSSRIDQLAQDIENVQVGLSGSATTADVSKLRAAVEGLESRQAAHEVAMEKALKELPAPAAAAPSTAASAAAPSESVAAVDVSSQLAEIQASVSGELSRCRNLVASPFSVMFDAVRTEDWVGQDSYLPFSKMNTNVGGGFDQGTGKFSPPVAGVYYFSLNVYGAPRDGVVLSIRANEFQEVASCSGVGKASQSCLLELDEKDIIGVYVNEKSKIVDTGKNRFTHFIGMLVKPKELMFA